uniref:uncharacterized protein LOC122600804 n=1 Tax=Erigeron canadensis TaxID=72917 RepID=UPI001CB9398D|nr:uncharacterized protein LOC122600804 [Erigeron canadensis]
MGDKNTNINKNKDDQETTEVLDTLSLTDFPITQLDDNVSTIYDEHQPNPPSSSATEDFFEFFQGDLSDFSEESMMSHAEDIIFCGKLVPINEQRQHTKPKRQSDKHHQRDQQVPIGCRRSRSEPKSQAKRITTSSLVRNSHSLDYKKLNRNSSISSEPTSEIRRDGSSKKSSSTRWYVLLFGLVKVPPQEMELRDIKNRQVRRIASKPVLVSPESSYAIPVSRNVDNRKCSWKVLGFLSCKSSSSAAVTTPLRYMPKV